MDPVIQPHQSPFSAMDNNPIMFNDPLGLKAEGWGGKKNEDGSTSWTYDEKLTKDSHEGYEYYMDEGYLFDATNRETGVKSDWKLNADGTSEDLNVNSIGEVEIRSSKTSTSAPAENKPYKSWASSSNPLGWNAGPSRNLIDQIAWDKKNVSAEIQKIWKRNRKNSDNLALLAWGNMAAPFVAIGGAYAGIVAGGVSGITGTTTFVSGSTGMLTTGTYYQAALGGTFSLATYFRFMNTAADATSQAITISSYGGDWNWGSTFGNLTFNNPFAAAAPGSIYEAVGDKNINENWKAHIGNYALSSGGNYVFGKLSNVGLNRISNEFNLGISGYSLPLLFNSATSKVVKNKTKE